jgi:hypothetical protein
VGVVVLQKRTLKACERWLIESGQRRCPSLHKGAAFSKAALLCWPALRAGPLRLTLVRIAALCAEGSISGVFLLAVGQLLGPAVSEENGDEAEDCFNGIPW